MQSLSYTGTFVFMHDKTVDTLWIAHGLNPQGGIKERLLALSGEPREIIRDPHRLTCMLSGSQKVLVEAEPGRNLSTVPAVIPMNLEALKPHYQSQIKGADRVVESSCRTLLILAADQWRYGYQFCIAEDSGLLLKYSILAPHGQPLERLIFTSLKTYDRLPEEYFEPTLARQDAIQHPPVSAPEAKLPPDPAWRISALPPGFYVREAMKYPLATRSAPVQQMVITDGLATISVFIAPLEERSRGVSGMTQSGAVATYMHEAWGHQVTVVGAVPAHTVELIGNAVQYSPGATGAAKPNIRQDD